MPPHRAARLRLVALWVAVAAYAAAVAVATTVGLELALAGDYGAYQPALLARWLALSAVPILIVSPLIAAVARTRRPRAVLVGSAVAAVAVVGWGYVTADAPWLSIVGVLTLPAAAFGTTVLALLPAAAEAARLRLPNVLVGIALALFGGLLLGFDLGTQAAGGGDPPLGAHFATFLLALAGLVGLVVPFPAPEMSLPGRGWVRPYLSGARDAVRHRHARGALIGLWLWAVVALAVVVALVRFGDGTAAPSPPLSPGVVDEGFARPQSPVTGDTVLFATAILGGVLLAGLNRHPYRHAWLAPYAAVAALTCFLWLRFGDAWKTPLVIVGLALGASFTGLLNAYLTWTTPGHHGAVAGLLVAGWCAAALALAGLLSTFGSDPLAARSSLLNVLIGVAAVAAVGAWLTFSRATLEGTVEPILCILYRIRTFGPGAEHLPARGPCLVIANHAAWFDPLWLGQALPAPITPMMTSAFYDLPVISWLMRHVYDTIRVPEVALRHEAPELQEAVKALDSGACVILFPEGYLRRKEEQPLRRFGRGVWKILSDRPRTPVFACWIEGNWGSYFSYRGGPPTKNKRMDFWRPIRIGVVGPFTVDPATLADHMATRTFLMRRVNDARAPLGLEPLALPAVPEGDKE